MPWLTLTLLGGFRARLESGRPVSVPTKKGQALLSYLALRLGQPEPRDKLSTLLWGDSDDEQARHNLRQTLFALRRSLPCARPPGLIVTDETLALNPAAVTVDVVAFERLVAEGTPEALAAAAALYQGDFLEGSGVSEAAFEDWLRGEQERLRARALEALDKLLAHQAQGDDLEGAVQTAVRLLALDPFQEATHRTLMRLYARQGRRGAALRQYQICLDVLQRELGVDPEAETKELYRELLPQGPRVSGTPAARVGARRPGRGRRGRAEAPGLEGPLVGREPEMTRLHRALTKAWRGRGQTVAIIGDAGEGKTRLVREVATTAEKRGGQLLLGRSYESEQVLAFGPWADALRAWLNTHPHALGGLATTWRAELGRLLPELVEPGLSPLASSDDHLRLFEAVARLVEHLASRRPLLLVLEDVHWADEMSVRLLSFLSRRLSGWPVLLVATARPDELAGAGALGRVLDELRREERLDTLSLSPLSRVECVRLTRSLVSAVTGGPALACLEEQVWALSEGNPFMIVETMRAVREGRAIATTEGLRLPERIRELITARLGRLSDLAQDLANVAALVGREFEFTVLQRAADLDALVAAQGVEELVRRRILHGVGERFDFSHDRIREVAAVRLSLPHRRGLHARIGRALEEVYADNLAPHYAALGANYREGQVWGKAVLYLHQAALQAMERSAYRETVGLLKETLGALAHLPASGPLLALAVDVRLDLRRSLNPLGEFSEILAYLREAEELAERLLDEARLARVLSYMIHELGVRAERTEALRCGERALAIAERLGDAAVLAAANFYMGELHQIPGGDYQRGAEFYRRSVEATRDDPYPLRFDMTGIPSVLSRTFLTLCLTYLGDLAAARPWAEEAVRMAETAAHPYSLAFAYLGLGTLLLTKGDLDEALAALERGYEVARVRELTQPFGIPVMLGFARILKGRHADGLALVQQGVRKVTESAAMQGPVADFLARLADAHLLCGQIGEARALAERTIQLAQAHEAPPAEAYGLFILARAAALDHAREDRSEVLHREAMSRYAELGMRPALAGCHLSLGRLYARWGRHEQARTEVGASLEMYCAMGAKALVARAEQALAAVS